MNEIATLILALAAALGLAACDAASTPPAEPPLAGSSIGGPFTLVNQDGETVRASDFAGKYRIMYFGYTYCPDVCPVDVQNIAAGLKLLEKSDPELAAKVVPIFVTVDPERDTPEVVKEFVSAFHPRMVGLTGTPEAIAKVAKDYAVFYQKRQSPGATGYLVDHSRQAYLMGPQGEPIALVPQDESPQAVADAIKRWVS